MKTLNFKVLALIVLVICSCQKQNKYTLTVEVPDDLNGGVAYLASEEGRELRRIDSVAVENGTFAFSGVQDVAAYRLVVVAKNDTPKFFTPVVLEQGEIRVVATEQGALLSGTASNAALQKFLDLEQSYSPTFNEIITAYYKTADDEQEKRKLIENQYDMLVQEYNETVLAFVDSNLNNAAGAYAFVQIYRDLTDDEQSQIVAKAGEEFLAQSTVARIAERLERVNKVAVGKHFVDFEMQNTAGDAVRLSDYAGRGNYLVVDFWASWCGPCRRAMPELKRIYAEYKERGVEVLGVSFDNNAEAWKAGLEELALPWAQMSDLKGWQSVATEIYGVNSIPHLMLIDPEGIIVAKNLDDDKLLSHLQEIFE